MSTVIDAQVHTWLTPSPQYPWSPAVLETLPPDLVPAYLDGDHSSEALLAMMDSAGVRTTILTSPLLYGDDSSYATDSAARHPGRFAVVAPFASDERDVALRAETFARSPWAIGGRLLLGSASLPTSPAPRDFVDTLLSALADSGLLAFVSPMGRFDEVARIADAFPDVVVVVDHLGLWLDAPIAHRISQAADVLRLARFSNIYMKCSAIPELTSGPYPFVDVVPLVRSFISEFGADRMMWGSDINQHSSRLSYRESLDYLRLSDAITDLEKDMILGGTAAGLMASMPAFGEAA